MEKKLEMEELDLLFEAILQLKNKEECFQFFQDLCTVKELQSLGQRMEVASMLQNEATYMDVVKLTGASTATISRVNRSLNYGNNGYHLVFDRMK